MTDRTRLVGLDGPRGIACLCVLVVHVVAFFAPLQLDRFHLTYLSEAIVYFFAMSGFLIYLPFVRAYAAGRPRPSLRRYTSQRVRRVYPGYVVIFLLANLALAAVYLDNSTDVARAGTDDGSGRITAPPDLLAHLTLVQNFSPDALQTGIAPSWSLTTELCFYVVLPLLVVVVLRGGRAGEPRLSRALLPAVAMAVLGVVGKVVTAALQVNRPEMSVADADFGSNGIAVLARSLFVLADNFAYGMVAVVLFVWMERGGLQSLTARRLWLVGCPAWFFTFAVALALTSTGSRFAGTAFAIAAGIFLLVVTEPAARGRESGFARLADWGPLRFVGKISLSVYLWHYPVILLVARHDWAGDDTPAGMVVSVAIVGALTTALSCATYYLVESPAMRSNPRRASVESAGVP
ncbi:acyltransferase [Aeromicrobium sp. NPDC092404]|uniref:acyltransferase family protein n=1 Tax=Aeromicrobium sp. NPDC092404 TaxID=3154976 RepID=UPI00344A7818